MMSAFLAICSCRPLLVAAVAAEREPEGVEQGPTLRVGAGGGHDRDVHPAGGVDLVVVDLREDELLGDPERVVAPAVETFRRQAPEVPDAGDGQADQPVEELPHAVAPERHLAADGVALAELEPGDRLLGPGHHGLLAGDGGQVADGALEQRLLLGRPADAHVDDDLLEARDHHHVGQLELLHDPVADLGVVPGLEAGPLDRAGGRRHYSSRPHVLHTRTFERRSPSTLYSKPTRTAPSLGHTRATDAMWTGMSLSMMPPLTRAFVWRWCFLATLTPSTMTFCSPARTFMIVPRLLRSLPVRTSTSSPFFNFAAICYKTSGASEMIRMKRLSRSSRPTGPKMRVPRGCC